MKKSISVLVLLAILAVGAFAQGISMSAGGGAIVDMSFNNGVKEDSDNKWLMRNMSFGGFVFFDATYAEVNVSFAYGLVSDYGKAGGSSFGPDKFGSVLQLGFSLLGKYPIELGPVTVFPLLGASYNMVLSAKDDDGDKIDDPMDFSQFGLLAGGGVDYDLTDSLYLRGEVLFQLRFASKTMKDMADFFGGDFKTTLGMGPVIKIAVGYRF
ncbi:MAG: hypothetical protein FWG27_02185 [Treponema sp.]|nr:hypothetical protein [Treponema sp.]